MRINLQNPPNRWGFLWFGVGSLLGCAAGNDHNDRDWISWLKFHRFSQDFTTYSYKGVK